MDTSLHAAADSQAVKKSHLPNDTFKEDESLNKYDPTMNGSAPDDEDDRYLLHDVHQNGLKEDHLQKKQTHGSYQDGEGSEMPNNENLSFDQNFGVEGSYQNDDDNFQTREDEEPLLAEDDNEPPLENDDEEPRDKPRRVHVEGTNVSSSHEGEVDAEGYTIDQHQETEHFSHTREVKEVDDHLEITQQDNRCLKLEEVRTKETVRQATAEEMKALLGARVFDDKDEIELGTEIIVEGFTRVTSTHEETDAGGVKTRDVTVTESREREEVHNDPNKPPQPSLEGNAPSKEEYDSQLQQMSSNTVPALTAGSEGPLSSQNISDARAAPSDAREKQKQNKENEDEETESTGCMQKRSRSSSRNRGDTLTRENDKDKEKNDKKKNFFSKSDSKTGRQSRADGSNPATDTDDSPAKRHGSAEDVLKNGSQKVHRGGFFCKQKHNKGGSKGQSPASTLERGSSLSGEEPKSKGWSLFGRKSGRSKNKKKGSGLDTSKSDHSTLGDSMDKDKNNSLDRSLNNSSRNDSVPQEDEKMTSRISTSSYQEPKPSSPKPQGARRASVNSITSPALSAGYSTVVAIDLGATVSSYSFSFPHDNPGVIYSMRKPQGSDPGLLDPKYPTVLLLNSEGEFHSFGFKARNVYHSLDPADAVKWMYFDSFRKQLTQILGTGDEPIVRASNGLSAPAAVLLEHALRFLSYEALQEMRTLKGGEEIGKVRWVITAPAGWHTEARHWIRQVAYKVGLASADFPQQLLVMQEPQAAAVSVHQLQLEAWQHDYQQQIQQLQQQQKEKEKHEDDAEETNEPVVTQPQASVVAPSLKTQCRSMVVSCGGDEVSVSVYDIRLTSMILLYQNLIINCGGTGVNDSFVRLVYQIFGDEFIEDYKSKKPAGWSDLIMAFESYKRALDSVKGNALNVPLPFSLIEHHKRHFGYDVELAIERFGKGRDIVWTQQGMLRLYTPAWVSLFRPVLDKILEAVHQATRDPAGQNIDYIWLVGGFSECPLLQHEIKNSFKQLQVRTPKDTSHVAAKGAVQFGVDPVQIGFTQGNDVIIPSRAR